MTLEPHMDSNMTPNRPGSIENPVLSRHSRERKEAGMVGVESKADRSEIATRVGLKTKNRASLLGIPKSLRAIRLKCLDCCCGQIVEIRECGVRTCALYPYRIGRYPKGGGDVAE